MNKLVTFFALLLFSLPTFASMDHWTCSNEQTVMYFILDTDGGDFMIFDDNGTFLAASRFSHVEKTKNGTPFMYAEIDDKLAIGITKRDGNIILALVNGKETAKFICD